MATKPQSPDYGRDLGKLEGTVGVLQNLSFAIITLLVAIVGGGIFLLLQISDVKSTASDTKRDIAAAVERISKLEVAIAELKTSQGSVTGSLARIENNIASALKGQPQPTPVSQLLISLNDAQTIRSALKFDIDTAYKGIGKLGDLLTDAKLSDFPEDLIEKFPQLKALRYVFNIKGQILIATASDQRVVAIV